MYTVAHIDEMVSDLLEDVYNMLLSRTITTKASTDVELPLFRSADSRVVTELRAERSAATTRRFVHALFMTVHNDGDTDFLVHLRDGIADSLEASTDPLRLTTYNSCFETVDGLLKENSLGTMMSGQSFHSSVTSLSPASRRQSPQPRRCHSSPLRYGLLSTGSDINIAAFIAPCWNVDGCFHVLIECRQRKQFVIANVMSLNRRR